MENLSIQDQEFVKEVALHGNQTQAAKKAYGIEDHNYAAVKGTRLLRKDNIETALEEVKKTLAERIPDELLERVHLEGLEATVKSGEEEKPDFSVRHKYLDTAYKLKGSYAPDKSLNVNVTADITDPKARELALEYEERLKQGL
jgi:hypothetical protein